MVRFSKFEALQKACNVLELIENELSNIKS